VLSQDPLATADIFVNQGRPSSPGQPIETGEFEVSLEPFLQAEADGRLATHEAERWAEYTVQCFK